MALKFFLTPLCCLPPGFARKVLNAILDYLDLLSPEWVLRFRVLARLLTLQCADIEWRHGRNRSRGHDHGKDSLTQMAARSVAGEAKVLAEAGRCQHQVLHQRQQPKERIEQGVPGPAVEKLLLRTPTPKDFC